MNNDEANELIKQIESFKNEGKQLTRRQVEAFVELTESRELTFNVPPQNLKEISQYVSKREYNAYHRSYLRSSETRHTQNVDKINKFIERIEEQYPETLAQVDISSETLAHIDKSKISTRPKR